MQTVAEYLILVTALVAILFLLSLIGRKRERKTVRPRGEKRRQPEAAPVEHYNNLIEIFDYKGIKIIQEKGSYTVNNHGFTEFFPSYEDLSYKYKKMISEIQNRRTESDDHDSFFIEQADGLYYVTTPDGRRRRYRKWSDIPERIRKSVQTDT